MTAPALTAETAAAAVRRLTRQPLAYQIAIPSYRRADSLGPKTLATLDRLGTDRDRVTVFTADHAEADTYRAALPGWRIAVGQPGLLACRRWYSTRYYPAGTRLLNLDDDIGDLTARTPDGKLAPYTGTVDALAQIGFGLCAATGARLWGITAVANGFFCADEAVVGLRYICGIFHGSHAGSPELPPDRPTESSGEDFETTLRSYTAHGAVVRLGWIAPKTVYFAPGGMQAELGGRAARDADHATALNAIAGRYPTLATVVTKARGVTNLRLRPITALRVPRAALEATADRPPHPAEVNA